MTPADRQTTEGILFTDQYQLSMANLYFRMGMHLQTAQFDYFFRNYPDYGLHKAGFCIFAGLEWLLDWMQQARFTSQDVALLRSQTGRSGLKTFDDDFLEWLADGFSFEALTLRAIPEGRVVHPSVPLVVVSGPLAIAQVLETALLNHLNFQTLIATRAARIRQSARGQMILEFGMRRGHDRGCIAGARAALIGGADFSSNVGISHVLGFPPKGTHSHSMVQAFLALGKTELEAFEAYAAVYPDDCLLLVDTLNTLHSGVPNAIRVFEKLRREGHKPVGIRIDSGDLAYLSMEAARLLNDAGFEDTMIVLSNDLDELVIWQILTQIQEEAPRHDMDARHLTQRLVFGVGTRLITSQGRSALDGVYKLVAMRKNDHWVPAIKISDSPAKTPNPGHKEAWRVYDGRGRAVADVLSLDDEDPRTGDPLLLHHPVEHTKYRSLPRRMIRNMEPLLEPVFSGGKRLLEPATIEVLRQRRNEDLSHLDPGVLRMVNPHIYHVSLTETLWNRKQSLIRQLKQTDTPGPGSLPTHPPPDGCDAAGGYTAGP